VVKRQPLPEGIEWRGKRSDAAGMARVSYFTINHQRKIAPDLILFKFIVKLFKAIGPLQAGGISPSPALRSALA